ncbi:hypothetical protein HFN_2040 [Helicobacter fennelliae MRY12-0050]|uniref:Uncharacterized protein n=1 Tax=Helicobacter fennelliae MRY12-0050 TaxID=1325130 RepID=T1DVC2_9HELI|nr:hypothetical protein HFN_2040 [Helicobacter fennelliae MRY12-0050]
MVKSAWLFARFCGIVRKDSRSRTAKVRFLNLCFKTHKIIAKSFALESFAKYNFARRFLES